MVNGYSLVSRENGISCENFWNVRFMYLFFAGDEMSNAAQKISSGANEQASSAEEISSTSEKLANQVEELRQLVKFFQNRYRRCYFGEIILIQ